MEFTPAPKSQGSIIPNPGQIFLHAPLYIYRCCALVGLSLYIRRALVFLCFAVGRPPATTFRARTCTNTYIYVDTDTETRMDIDHHQGGLAGCAVCT
jgi:hypothetical protein